MPEPSRGARPAGAAPALPSARVERSPEVVYRTFLSAVNDRDVEAAAGCVDRVRYREDCVGFTGGWGLSAA